MVLKDERLEDLPRPLRALLSRAYPSALPGVLRLDLSRAQITALPHSLTLFSSLTSLDLSCNALDTIPAEVPQLLPAVRVLNLSSNRLASLDEIRRLGALECLEELDLRRNPHPFQTQRGCMLQALLLPHAGDDAGHVQLRRQHFLRLHVLDGRIVGELRDLRESQLQDRLRTLVLYGQKPMFCSMCHLAPERGSEADGLIRVINYRGGRRPHHYSLVCAEGPYMQWGFEKGGAPFTSAGLQLLVRRDPPPPPSHARRPPTTVIPIPVVSRPYLGRISAVSPKVNCCAYMLDRAPRYFAPVPPDRDKYLTDGSFAFEHTGGVRDTYFLELPQPCTLKLNFECEIECMLLVTTNDSSFIERKDGKKLEVRNRHVASRRPTIKNHNNNRMTTVGCRDTWPLSIVSSL